MKDKDEELSNIGIKTFAIGTGDEEVINEGVTIGGDCTVRESFGFCCPGVEPEFFAESTNALLFSLISPMNNVNDSLPHSRCVASRNASEERSVA